MQHVENVEGLALPARLSGHPALDFTNTWAGWNGGDQREYLASYEHLVVWCGFVGLLEPEQVTPLRAEAAAHPRAAAAVLAQARDARALVYGALAGRRDAASIAPLANALKAIAGRVRLTASGDGIGWRVDDQAGLAAPVVAVLWSAAQLLTSAHAARIRSCPGRGCGWLFIDRSGRRRWCTMATCGNREKARRFAHRQRSS